MTTLQRGTRPDLASDLLRGALAGFLATGPMTVAMEAMRRRLPYQERYPLPPSEITSVVTIEAGLRERLSSGQRLALTTLLHFGYGAAVGALYAPSLHRAAPPPALRGSLYGLIVWGASYLGWLPALGILRPATEHPPRRTALMIAAHLVWGSSLGLLVDRFERRS